MSIVGYIDALIILKHSFPTDVCPFSYTFNISSASLNGQKHTDIRDIFVYCKVEGRIFCIFIR